MPKPDARSNRESLDAVAAIYRDLDARPADRDCRFRTECCHFRLTGLTPHVTLGEALFAARGVRASGRTRMPDAPDGTCPFLGAKAGRCMIYAHRPFGCRTHFCKAAGGPVARKEILDLIRRLETIDARLGGDGPREFLPAIRDALDGWA
jgi:Fe-S-cluster containining protein